MADWETLVGFVSVGAMIAGGLLWAYRALGRHDKQHLIVETSLQTLLGWAAEDAPARKVSADVAIRQFERTIQGNPVTPAQIARRQALTTDLNSGRALSPAELGELLGILQAELEDAQAANAAVVVVALFILIALVIAALAAARAG